MYALVVVESMFGNTREVGHAVARGLAAVADVDVVDVVDAPRQLRPGTDLLVVGAPTHAFSLSRPSTRADARRQAGAPEDSAQVGTGVREWLAVLDTGGADVVGAAFDTRVAHPHLPGSAARAAHRRLQGRGLTTPLPPESFWVDGTAGPLRHGEVARATGWGTDLGRAASERHRRRPVGA
ncbi:flavodoxin family protein [Cellulomonas sp. NPDC055163]